jgi:hypothetical protein
MKGDLGVAQGTRLAECLKHRKPDVSTTRKNAGDLPAKAFGEEDDEGRTQTSD